MTDTHDFDRDDELRARLRAADPAASLGPADPERVARLLEDTMSHDTETQVPERRTGTRGRNPLTWLVAAAAVLVIGGVGVFTLTGSPDDDSAPPVAENGTGSSDGPEPVVISLRAPTGASGRCMVPNAEVLAQQQVAFAGTVDEISDGTVVLTPTTTYAGDEADRVEVVQPSEEMTQLIGAVDFQVGETYLVSATDGQVTVCGFSGPATPELEQLYTDAFGG
ncbi:hypothetical protein [Nocardioides lianchengensis]|uniref:Uncharacterized protein n=1 Tax=Nocardioides lianchengensis TaxID=1045774 RepID=A0A1G6I4P5_9ACTN|nr:hypothetical protein [Nocardioides lianchengensis]NYG13184.1 hypothetical protein [Nocardioides lianchengensis]SDC01025.1 hypothetical protein SAMN05421872_10142 [Nocardioides lianchengensis]